MYHIYDKKTKEKFLKKARKFIKEGQNMTQTVILANTDNAIHEASCRQMMLSDFECCKYYRIHYWHKRTNNTMRFLTFREQVILRSEESRYFEGFDLFSLADIDEGEININEITVISRVAK